MKRNGVERGGDKRPTLQAGVERIRAETLALAETYDLREWWAARDVCVELLERCDSVLSQRYGVQG